MLLQLLLWKLVMSPTGDRPVDWIQLKSFRVQPSCSVIIALQDACLKRQCIDRNHMSCRQRQLFSCVHQEQDRAKD